MFYVPVPMKFCHRYTLCDLYYRMCTFYCRINRVITFEKHTANRRRSFYAMPIANIASIPFIFFWCPTPDFTSRVCVFISSFIIHNLLLSLSCSHIWRRSSIFIATGYYSLPEQLCSGYTTDLCIRLIVSQKSIYYDFVNKMSI